MARRPKDWDKGLAKKLQNKKFAKKYLLGLVEDKQMPLKLALKRAVLAYGVKEFSEACGCAQPNVSRALEEQSNPQISTLEKLLEPFDVTLSVKGGSK